MELFKQLKRIEDNVWTNEPKCNKQSLHHRERGNSDFNQDTIESILAALIQYNKAVCFAEDSKQMSIAYAKRATVYLKLKLYDICLKNIEMACAASNLPEKLWSKLDDHKQEALAAIAVLKHQRRDELAPIEPRLSRPANAKIPFVVNCLKLKPDDRQSERYVISTKHLEVGDVIAIETPFCAAVGEQQQYERCDNCCIEAARSLIPCPNCVYVMYCSAECRDDAYKRFHRFECKIMRIIYIQLPTADMRLALRTAICALTEFDSLDALAAYVNDGDTSYYNLFDIDYGSGRVGAKERYGPVHGMKVGVANYETPNKVYQVGAVFSLLIKNTNVYGLTIHSAKYNLMLELLHRYLHATISNQCVIKDAGLAVELHRDGPQRYADDDSLGMYPFRHLLNHACLPNVIVNSCGNRLIYTVIRPIEPNEQILDNYNCHHLMYPLAARIRQLPFVCTCIACQKIYPTLRMLPNAIADLPTSLGVDTLKELYHFDRRRSVMNKKKAAEYLQRHNIEYPNRELVLLGIYYRHIVDMLYCKDIPLAIRFISHRDAINNNQRMMKRLSRTNVS